MCHFSAIFGLYASWASFPSFGGSEMLFWHIHHAARCLPDLFIVRQPWALNKEQMSSQAYFHPPLTTKSVTFSRSSLRQQLLCAASSPETGPPEPPLQGLSWRPPVHPQLFLLPLAFLWARKMSFLLKCQLSSAFPTLPPSLSIPSSTLLSCYLLAPLGILSCIYLWSSSPTKANVPIDGDFGVLALLRCCLWLRTQNSAWHIIGAWMDEWVGGWMDGWMDGWANLDWNAVSGSLWKVTASWSSHMHSPLLLSPTTAQPSPWLYQTTLFSPLNLEASI